MSLPISSTLPYLWPPVPFGFPCYHFKSMSARSEASEAPPTSSWADRIYLHIYDYETKEFSGLTTYHGLVRIYNSNTWPSRIFWCVVVVSCLSLFMIHSGYLLLGYHSKPTLFQVNTIVPPDGLQFRDITICSNNPIDPRKIQEWNVTAELAAYLTNSYSLYISSPPSEEIKEEYLELAERVEKERREPFDVGEFLLSIAPSCPDVLISCSFAGRVIPNCCSFTKPVITDVGPCFRISGEVAKRKQWYSGSGFGWQFVVDSKNHLKTDHLAEQFMDDGVRILAHQGGATMRSRSLATPPGNSLFVSLDTKNVSLLQRNDWGFCQKHWNPALNGKQVLPLKYSSVHCEWNHEANQWVDICGCVPFHLHFNQSHTVCDPFQIAGCQDRVSGSSSLHYSCDLECDYMQYDMSHSYADLGPRSLPNSLKYSDEYIRDSISVIWLYFRSISVERQEQQKQLQTADLLSNIAGSMGLFLGMSTVTLLEIFIYLFKSVWGTVNTERQKQFLQAMIEEEEERKQSLVIVEEPAEPASGGEEEGGEAGAPSAPRRYSVMPIHLHLDRSRTGRRDSGIDALHVPRRSISVAPMFNPGHRLSVAEVLQRRGSHFQTNGAGDILPGRRNSGVPGSMARLALPMNSSRRFSVQPTDDAVHLSFNGNRRKSSIRPKDFLL